MINVFFKVASVPDVKPPEIFPPVTPVQQVATPIPSQSPLPVASYSNGMEPDVIDLKLLNPLRVSIYLLVYKMLDSYYYYGPVRIDNFSCLSVPNYYNIICISSFLCSSSQPPVSYTISLFAEGARNLDVCLVLRSKFRCNFR